MDYVIKHAIVPLLSPPDVLRFSQTCRKWRYLKNRLPEIIAKKIDERLRLIFGDSFDIFKKYLAGKCISGSFILQCATGEFLPDSDIDIFTQNDITDIFKPVRVLDSRYEFDNDIVDIRNYKFNKQKIQCVQIGVNIRKHIRKTDFDICHNIFYYKAGTPVLEIKCPLGAVNKITRFSIRDVDDWVYRSNKYALRNYKFIPIHSPEIYIEFFIITRYKNVYISYRFTNKNDCVDCFTSIIPRQHHAVDGNCLHINKKFAPNIHPMFFEEYSAEEYVDRYPAPKSTYEWERDRKHLRSNGHKWFNISRTAYS